MQDTRIKHRVPQHTLYVGTNSLFDHSIVVFAEFVSGFLCILPDLSIIGIKRSSIDQTMSLLRLLRRETFGFLGIRFRFSQP